MLSLGRAFGRRSKAISLSIGPYVCYLTSRMLPHTLRMQAAAAAGAAPRAQPHHRSVTGALFARRAPGPYVCYLISRMLPHTLRMLPLFAPGPY